LADPVAGSFPTEWKGFSIKAIVKDSLQFNDSAPSESNVEVEDMDEYFATLETDKGSKGFTVQTYDLSESAYTYLLKYEKASENNTEGWISEQPGEKVGNQAVQITTKKLGTEFVSRIYQWANMKLAVTHSGTIGKSGFPNLNITFTKQANLDADGVEQSGARWRQVTA
jgi:hypothetical protein